MSSAGTFDSSRNSRNRQSCMDCALGLLERRPHSILELTNKLRQRSFPRPVIETAIEELKRLSLLDDSQFAAMFIEEKTRSATRPVGRQRILQELKRRGVDSSAAATAWQEIEQRGNHESEEDRAQRAAEQKMKLIQGQTEERKIREKLWRHLASRGFSRDVVAVAIERVMSE